MISDLTTNTKINRLTIFVSGEENLKVLAVPAVTSETVMNIATSVFESLEDWGLKHRIKGRCFYKTAVNTRYNKQGSAMIIMHNIGNTLQPFAGRHHILELILSHVLTSVFPLPLVDI